MDLHELSIHLLLLFGVKSMFNMCVIVYGVIVKTERKGSLKEDRNVKLRRRNTRKNT